MSEPRYIQSTSGPGWSPKPLTIVEFLTARLDEAEQLAKDAALMSGWDGFGETRIASGLEWVASYHVVKRRRAEGEPIESRKGRELADCGSMNLERAKHIAYHDPAYVLADIAAKRAIIAWCGEREQIWVGRLADDPDDQRCYVPGGPSHPADSVVLRFLASVYSDHPDYNPKWKP